MDCGPSCLNGLQVPSGHSGPSTGRVSRIHSFAPETGERCPAVSNARSRWCSSARTQAAAGLLPAKEFRTITSYWAQRFC